MNGGSGLIIFVLVIVLIGAMVFMVSELNRSAEEILADRATITDLQEELEQARISAAAQQVQIEALTAALAEKQASLDQAAQALAAAQAEAAALRQALQEQQQARAGFEQLAADLANQVQALQARTALLETGGSAENETISQRSMMISGGAGLPLVTSVLGLVLAGGGVVLGRRGKVRLSNH